MSTLNPTQRNSKGLGTLAGLEFGRDRSLAGFASYSVHTSVIPSSTSSHQRSIFQSLYFDEHTVRRKEMRCHGKTHKNGKSNTERWPGNDRKWSFRNQLSI
jgi:hypothetical protein